jgi:hypothetical protein
VGTSQFVIDSGATSHVCKDNVFAPSTFVGSGGVFQTQSKYASFNSAGYGSAVVPMVVSSGGTSDVDFHNAYYTPDGNFNLISSLVLVKKFGWQNPDFVKDVWVTNTGVPLRISYHKGLPVLTAKIVSVAVEPNDALVAVGGGHGSRDRDTSDWQFRISLSQHLARTYASSGEWTHDLFTDGNGVTNGNSMAPIGYSIYNPAENHVWTGGAYWANPPYTAGCISKLLIKAIADFQKDPLNTCFLIILPVWEDSQWWHLTRHFEQVQLWPKDSDK